MNYNQTLFQCEEQQALLQRLLRVLAVINLSGLLCLLAIFNGGGVVFGNCSINSLSFLLLFKP